MRFVFVSLALSLLAPAMADAPTDVFKAVSQIPCAQLEENLATLQSIHGSYSLAIAGRAAQYRAMQGQLRKLEPVAVPYQGEDLSAKPLETPTGLQSTYKTVPHQVADPYTTYAVVETVFAGLGAGATIALVPSGSNPDPMSWVSFGGVALLTLVAGGAAIYGFTHTKTVYVQKYDPAAVAANQRIKDQLVPVNRAIQEANDKNRMKREQRQAAVTKNAQLASERSALEVKMQAFERQSSALARQRIDALGAAANRRCVAQLVYEGAAVRLGTQASQLYVIVRALNPAHETLNAPLQAKGLTFGVRAATLSDPGGVVAHVERPAVTAVMPASDAPTRVTYPANFVAIEFDLSMQRPAAADGPVSIDAVIGAEQGGSQFRTEARGTVGLLK